MNKFSFTAFAILFFTMPSFAQFYYNDVLVNRQNMEKHLLYKQLRVTRIVAKSSSDLDAPGTEPLTIEQNYNSSYSQFRTRTSINTGKSSISNYYNPQGRLYRTVDSSENAITTYEYQFEGDKLQSITSTSFPPGEKQKTVESHLWYYNTAGCPQKMLRIRNQTDSSEIRFVCDDSGRVTEEQAFRKNVGGEKVYYYYDEQGKLSDVVRYQEKLGKLIPDYTFDHDGQGRVSQMMVVQNGGMDYITWKYEYNGQGLPVRESCFSRQKKLVGKVEYSYEMKR